jgi:hypothetical protein
MAGAAPRVGQACAAVMTERPCYAGIGSRQTPPDVLARMRSLAATLERTGFVLRSGAARGADTHFEIGTRSRLSMEIYLPWPGFNGHWSSRCHVSHAALELAARFHPNWSACNTTARLLHGRNSYQVLGPDLNGGEFLANAGGSPSKFVACWTADGKASGGTGQALRIAEAHGIPIFNLFDPTAEARLFASL